MYKDILEKANSYRRYVTSLLIDLINIQSFSTKEKQVVERIQKEMTDIGFDSVKIDGLGNVIGRIGNGKKSIVFDAHIDTVYPGNMDLWKSDPFSAYIENECIYGRGTVDQKGGMASMLCASKIIKELGLAKDISVYFVGSVMEEDCDGLCWQYIIKEDKLIPDLVVITEPTNLNIYRGHRGRMEISVSIGGVSCHGSAPERGENALYKMSRIILEIEKLNERLRNDSFLGKGTVAVTQISISSPSQCAVPDFAKIQLDRRLTVGENEETSVKEIRDIIDMLEYKDAKIEVLEYSETAYTGLTYKTKKYFPTWTLDKDSIYLKNAVKSYKELFNSDPIVDKWTFSTNGVAISGMHNIPCIGFGPGNEVLAHAPNENCSIDHLVKASAFYTSLVGNI